MCVWLSCSPTYLHFQLRPDEKTSEAVKLFAVKVNDSAITEADIIDYCRAHLTAYKVPKHVVFIDEVPKSAVGKMLRRVLSDT